MRAGGRACFPQLKLKQTGDAPLVIAIGTVHHGGETDAMATMDGARRNSFVTTKLRGGSSVRQNRVNLNSPCSADTELSVCVLRVRMRC